MEVRPYGQEYKLRIFDAVLRILRFTESGNMSVHIHGVGFSVLFASPDTSRTSTPLSLHSSLLFLVRTRCAYILSKLVRQELKGAISRLPDSSPISSTLSLESSV